MPANPFSIRALIVPGAAARLAVQAADEQRRLDVLEADVKKLMGKIQWRRTRLVRIEAALATAERIEALPQNRRTEAP